MDNEIEFPIGKYKRQKICECTDLKYLLWYDESIRSTPGVRRAVYNQINNLTKKK